MNITFSKGGICDRLIWSFDFKSLAPHCFGFEFGQGLSCEEAIQLDYGTSVVLLRCPLVLDIMYEGATEVFLHQ